MSEQLTAEHVEQAAQCIGAEVMAPVFFNKLASFGITPTTEAEAQQLLELGAKLAVAAEQGVLDTSQLQKQADADSENSFLKAANDNLDSLLQQTPVSAEIRAATAANIVQNNELIKTAALILAQAQVAAEEPDTTAETAETAEN